MKYKIAYSTINKEEVKAWECQIEKGRYYLPADATYLKPLENKDGFNIIFKNKKWVYEEIKIIEDRYIINKTTNEITKSNKELNDDEKVATNREINRYLLPKIKNEKILSIKSEAQERIYNIYPLHTQLNYLAEISEIQDKQLNNIDITEEEKATLIKGKEIKAEIKNIRDKSNEIERMLENKTIEEIENFDIQDNSLWA
jgi:hypothetical protein